MLKTALALVLKRYWGLIAAIVMINAFSQYRHAHHIAFAGLGVSLLGVLVVLSLTALPVELHKLRHRR